MTLKQLVLTFMISAFALASSGASAETYHFGEGQSSVSNSGSAARHAPAPKHRKHNKTRSVTHASKNTYSRS
jgi:hypothetical protein